MTADNNDDLLMIRGIVVPIQWAEDGSVTAVGISGFDERDYIVSAESNLNHWISLLRQEVELTGVVVRTEGKTGVIKVHEYCVAKKGEAHEVG